jgi:AraC family transcriptional regulator of adaptative response / DNA-3-methyladenine glycosylase II
MVHPCPNSASRFAAGGSTVPVVAPIAGVVTTGIYCRPSCGAEPSARNVRPFPSAAAAEAAGFRACLRCRPYRAAEVPYTGGVELVRRGIQMIVYGALDGKTEAELAACLAVSPRHLRRLFVEHAGVTPDGLARSARAHFARRLLDDTDLSITEIAFAVGFTSLRQFNRACQEIFRASPRQLRARRRKADRLVADGGLALRLPFYNQLDWDATLAYLASRAIPGVEQVAGGVYRRTIISCGNPGVLELMPGGDDHLRLIAHLPHWDDLLRVVQRARRIANLDFPLEEAAGGLARDPIIGSLVQARPGVRPPGAWDPFETAVYEIVAHRKAPQGTATVIGRIVERYGTPVPGLEPFGLDHVFPAAETLAAANLEEVGLTGLQADAIRSLSVAVANGSTRLDHSASLEQLTGSIAALRGVGDATARRIAFRLGEPDAWPVSDRSLDGLSERARPWRALAATYVWLMAAHPQGRAGTGTAA